MRLYNPAGLVTGGRGVSFMDSYRCKLCGYIYNPKIGDVANGIKPKTAFEDIPASWRCPRCGAGKDRFVKV